MHQPRQLPPVQLIKRGAMAQSPEKSVQSLSLRSLLGHGTRKRLCIVVQCG
jgi:hypothetical protein